MMGLQANLKTETVDKLELRDPLTIEVTASVRDAVSLMRKGNLGCAIVVDEDRKPKGIFTESLLAELLAHHPDQLDDPVEKHLAEQVPWVRDSDPVSDVLEAMQLKNIRMLCVVDKDDRLIGVTGQRGLMEYVAEHFPGDVPVQRIGLPSSLSDREGA